MAEDADINITVIVHWRINPPSGVVGMKGELRPHKRDQNSTLLLPIVCFTCKFVSLAQLWNSNGDGANLSHLCRL